MYYQYYRRQTPEEDYLSTQQGIEILVKQRQQLVDQLTKHYRKLYRSNQIESLLKFSEQIDSIMRLRGFQIVPSPKPSSRTQRRLALPPMERGVTIHDQKFWIIICQDNFLFHYVRICRIHHYKLYNDYIIHTCIKTHSQYKQYIIHRDNIHPAWHTF